MNILKLTTPIPPSVNHYLNYRVGRSGRKTYVQSYPAVETINYQAKIRKYVAEQIELQGWEIPDKDTFVYVYITFYFARKRKDSNNYLKVPFDVFTDAKVWHDDDKALPIVERVYIDRENPHAEFTIVPAEFKGIFDNEKDLSDFKEKNCKICTKNEANCMVLKSLLGNEISSNTTKEKCNKIRIRKNL